MFDFRDIMKPLGRWAPRRAPANNLPLGCLNIGRIVFGACARALPSVFSDTGGNVKRNWIVAGMSLTLCAVGALAIIGDHPQSYLKVPWTAPRPREYVRIELPPVEVATADLSADIEAATLLREAFRSSESPATGGEPGFATADASSSEQGQTGPPSRAQVPVGLLDVRFDLSRPDLADRDSLDFRKGVRFNGADAGQVTIRVGAGSALFIASDDLRILLSEVERTDVVDRLAASSDRLFFGFDEVRQAGLSLKYDAASDRILITG